MARLANKRPSPSDSDEEPALRPTSTRVANRLNTATPVSQAHSTSPTAASSSDKENRTSRNARSKSKMPALGESSMSSQPGASKRRRVGNTRDTSRAASVRSEATETPGPPSMSEAEKKRALNDVTDTRIYDPEQDVAERRKTRMGYSNLNRQLQENRDEHMHGQPKSIITALKEANKWFGGVKQTTDATLDSKFLVTAGDISAKRAIQNKYGGADLGVDVDEFVQKCKAFMRRSPTDEQRETAPAGSTQRRRHIQDDSDEETQQDEDELNWPWLGLKACYPYNIRPPVPGFLLGPLAVQKKVRKITQRRARQERRDPADARRPDELQADQIERQENANLTKLCEKILYQLEVHIANQGEAFQQAGEKLMEDLGREELTKEEMNSLCLKFGILFDPESQKLGACLEMFAFNPKSFGQTVENLFYISFLIRDGKIGIVQDENGLSALMCDPGGRAINRDDMTREEVDAAEKAEEKRLRSAMKYQSVLHLDFDIWAQVCESYGIKECVIPHRVDDGGKQLGATGWY